MPGRAAKSFRFILGAALAGAAFAVCAAEPEAQRASPQAYSRPPALDLTAPPLTHVLSARDIEALETEPDPSEEANVEVDSTRYHVPVPRGFLQALPWAVMHPLQAWRVLTPVTEE